MQFVDEVKIHVRGGDDPIRQRGRVMWVREPHSADDGMGIVFEAPVDPRLAALMPAGEPPQSP